MKPWKAFLIVVVLMIIFGVICVYYLAQQGLLADKVRTRFSEKVKVLMPLSLQPLARISHVAAVERRFSAASSGHSNPRRGIQPVTG